MPDGDLVHAKLTWNYQNIYKQLCSGQYGGEELATDAASAVWKDIQKDKHDRLIGLLQQVSEQAQAIRDRNWFETINWQQENARIDALAQPLIVDRRLKHLAVEACKELLLDLRYGNKPSDCHIDVLTKYAWNVYVAQFEERVPQTADHHRQVSREFVQGKLDAMRPHVLDKLQPYIQKTHLEGTFQRQRSPHRRSGNLRGYDVDTDLSTIGA